MSIYLWFVGLYFLIGVFVVYFTEFYKGLFEETEKFTSDYLKSKSFPDKLLGIVGYFSFGIVLCIMFIVYPILLGIGIYYKIRNVKTPRQSINYVEKNKSITKEKGYPPIEIQVKYEGVTPPIGCFIKHAENVFNLQPNQIIYVEDEYNPVINDYFTNHYDKIKQIVGDVNQACHLKLELLYIPRIIDELKNNNNIDSILSYYFPGFDLYRHNTLKNNTLTFISRNFTEILLEALNFTGEVHPGFIRIKKDRDKETGEYQYSYVNVSVPDNLEFEKVLYFYFSHVGDVEDQIYYSLASENSFTSDGRTYELSEFRFNYDAHKLALDIKKKIDLLRHSDSQHLLLNILGQQYHETAKTDAIGNNGLSRLVIEKDFRIILPDYDNLEIELTPLPKTVFLFFLLHPEGVLLKHLCDHRSELLAIYKQLSYRETWEEIIRSIDELVDPTKNSINEKCSRVKESFIKHFEERLARFYYITGDRGKEKRITLNRDLLTWDIENSILPIPVKAKSVETSNEIETQVNKLYNEGKEQLSKKNYTGAIELFTKVLALNKYHFNAVSMRAIAYFETGNYQQAMEDNDRAIELHPSINVAHHNRAEAKLLTKDFLGALEDINLYIAHVDRECKASYFLRGLIKNELNDHDGACQDWYNAKYLGHPNAESYLLKYPKCRISKPIFVELPF
jgi:tetratricopeptide (TPR) repeat protein